MYSKLMYSETLLYDHFVTTVTLLLWPLVLSRENAQNRHILIIRLLKPVYIFIFSLLVLYVLIKVLNILKKIVFAFWMLIKEQLFRSSIICDASVKMPLS